MSQRVCTVVIGSNFGDEGKGLITDFEVQRTTATYVARFNGGAQAGHTVQHADKRHVFGHLGAGTLAGADTYLGSRFIVNPMLFKKERSALLAMGVNISDVAVHPDAPVSTVYDMALNAIAEQVRQKRHGSCGVGINETVTRHQAGYRITAGDLWSDLRLRQVLARIQAEWVPKRLLEITAGAAVPKSVYLDTLNLPPSEHAMLISNDARGLRATVPEASNVVFEGAQGLALDERLGVFPHVTRSMTGLPYAIITAAELGITTLQPTYVTRAYLTRHGAGELPYEGVTISDRPIKDTTNVMNEWQGYLRFAPLNVPLLRSLIGADLERARHVSQALGVTLVQPTLAVTCLDQVGPRVTIVDADGELQTIDTESLPRYLARTLNLRISHTSSGPSAKDVHYHEHGV